MTDKRHHETEAPHLTPEVTRLRTALHHVRDCAADLLEDVRPAKHLLSEDDEPHRSEYPGRTPGDPELLRKGERYPTSWSCTRDGEPTDSYATMLSDRKIGWPRLLDLLQEDLEAFWPALDEAQAAIDALLGDTAQTLDAITHPHWKVRLRRTLDVLGTWLDPARPRDPKLRGRPSSMEAMINVLSRGDLPDFGKWFAELQRADEDLWATRGTAEGDEPTGTSKKKRRSTVRGGGSAVILAGLVAHHRYENGSCENLEPINVNEFAKKFNVGKATISAFLQKEFGHQDQSGTGHTLYRVSCLRNMGRDLAYKLQALRGEEPTFGSSLDDLPEWRHPGVSLDEESRDAQIDKDPPYTGLGRRIAP